MNRIKRISMQLIVGHRDMFSDDFEKNKEAVNKLAVIRSKRLKNKVTGYITIYVKGEIDDKEETEEDGIKEDGIKEDGIKEDGIEETTLSN